MFSDNHADEAGTITRPLATLLASVALVIVVIDQLTKLWARNALDDPIDLFWTLRFRLTFNTGSAFSIGAGNSSLIGAIAIVVVIALLFYSRSVSSRLGAWAIGLVLGGALGNLVDRFIGDRDGFLGGSVTDFVDFQWWPVFNVADVAIVVGAGLMLWVSSRVPESDPESAAMADV